MRTKLDENVPSTLVDELAVLGHDVDSVKQEGLKGFDDDKIWEAAQLSGRFLITQDLDFSDIRKFKPGTHHGLLLIRFHNPGRRVLKERITRLFESEDTNSCKKCFIVATDSKIRIRRPNQKEKNNV